MAASPPGGRAAEAVAARIDRHGPIPFDELVELALYHPVDGFYSGGGAAGRRRGDFITSPEVGPLFGALLARWLDRRWDQLGRPDPYLVVEAGAGVGTLARSVLAAAPACRTALTYVLVERSSALRARHAEHLPLTEPQLVVSPSSGPRAVSLGALPAVAVTGVVLANELLDNLPFGLAERRADGWYEVRVGTDPVRGGFTEVVVPAARELGELLSSLVPEAPAGSRVPVQRRAGEWLRDALFRVERGAVLLLDYASTTPALARRPSAEWLRTYREHERGADPLRDVGRQDITVEVCVDQLARVRPPDRDRPQHELLRELGIDQLVEEGRRTWHERAHIGDLEAIRGRSRVREAEALLDVGGLGSFRAFEWEVGGSGRTGG